MHEVSSDIKSLKDAQASVSASSRRRRATWLTTPADAVTVFFTRGAFFKTNDTLAWQETWRADAHVTPETILKEENDQF